MMEQVKKKNYKIAIVYLDLSRNVFYNTMLTMLLGIGLFVATTTTATSSLYRFTTIIEPFRRH